MILDFWLPLNLPVCGCRYEKEGERHCFHSGMCVCVCVYLWVEAASDWVIYEDVRVQQGIIWQQGLSHTGRRGPVCNEGPQRQEHITALITDISPKKVLFMCYRDLSCKSSMRGNSLLLFSIKDSYISFIFAHLVDVKKSGEDNRPQVTRGLIKKKTISTVKLYFSFPCWIAPAKKVTKRVEVKGWIGNQDRLLHVPPILIYISRSFSVCHSSQVILHFLAPQSGLYW